SSGASPSYHQPASYDVGTFMVQVGAFSVQANAQRLADKMRSQYGNATIAEGWVDDKKFYRVRVGLYSSMTLAVDAHLKLVGDGFNGSFVVAR
ncbi:MAG: SPOR domain-containing protein, partial [Desulfuromonadales bacterium]|nr:SPOR domain-containing protein [Desulfuromonadales bacterium]